MAAPAAQHPAFAIRAASPRAGSTLARAVQVLAAWEARARGRGALARLDAAGLADLGLSATQAAREAAKPFWRA